MDIMQDFINSVFTKQKARQTMAKWKISGSSQNTKDGIFWHTNIVCGGKRVAQSSGIGVDEAIAIARSIVRDHNSHDKLLEACKEAEKLLSNMIIPMGVLKRSTLPNRVLSLLVQALALAEKED